MNKIIGINTKTLEEKEFSTIEEANKYIGSVSVKRCLENKMKRTNGWIFRYNNEDFPEKARTITDKRIKIFVLTKEDKEIKLPMEMINNLYGISKSSLIEASQGFKKEGKNKVKIEFAKGYKVREATEEEKLEVLNEISYVDYLKSFKNAVPKERNQSIGEGVVERILSENNIEYETEKRIPNTRMLMDFYVIKDGKEFCIEFQGVHHDGNRYQGRDLEKRQLRDRNKKKYCQEHNIKLIEIFHNDTIGKIYEVLDRELNLSYKPKVYKLYKGKEIDIELFIENYKSKNREEMAELYEYNQTDIKNILDKLDYGNKRKPKYELKVYDKKTGDFVFRGGYYEVLEKFPSINQSDIPRILRGERKSTGGYKLEKVED